MATNVQTQNAKRTFWRSSNGVLLAVAVLSSVVAWWMIAWPVVVGRNAADHAGHFVLTFAHMAGGSGMLFLGGLNLYLAAQKAHFPLHRRIGQSYLVVGAFGSVTALVITLSSAHKDAGPILTNTSISLSMLSLAWLLFSAMGWRAVRNRRFDSHRDWMIRSYVLVWSFVFCRIASRVSTVEDLGSGQAFIWLSWVIPLIISEVVLQWSHGSRKSRPSESPLFPS